MEAPHEAPSCTWCRWFAVTWDAAFPHSCSLFGIKCRELPSLEVYRSTGTHCPAFDKSERIKEE